ncbi:MAG: aminopeptidase [Faecalimonas sp.]|nr:aminopeptidase [Faecalimonas sp.]
MSERYELSLERIRAIVLEKTVAPRYRDYFQTVARFLLEVDGAFRRVQKRAAEACSLEELQEENRSLYQDVLGARYESSYANPSYAVSLFGKELGQLLSFLYTELRGTIAYAYEGKVAYLTICNELFIEVYNCFEGVKEPDYTELSHIVYWYASDYCDVFVADRIREQVDPESSFAIGIIMDSDLADLRYLYKYGEYISENEWRTAEYLNSLPQETIDRMAEVYTEGYRMGFVHAGIDLSKKSSVDLHYVIGFERVLKKAIANFAKMGLKPTTFRAALSVMTRSPQGKRGYYGGTPNKQYEYDHRNDIGLVLDKKYVERKLDVMKNAYEECKELAASYAGPAVMEVFGEEPFSPLQKEEAIALSEAQEELSVLERRKAVQLTNQYIKGEERSFTIVAYPVPEIGECYEEIFQETIRINTLDAELYEKVQQTLIDVLDKGAYVHILGKDDNVTDLQVQLYKLSNPEKETVFENCVADVNIPVGEVFTSPVLEGTKGVLHVSKVYLNELQYRDLKIVFEDGKISSYRCGNFESEEEGKKYIKSNLLQNHETLPLGEFAIGTNTTAYVMAKKYQIEEKLPILIAEKMGPHFAIGDTCYSWSEENCVYNPNGKEIVAKDNSISILRKEDVAKAYFQCHTDITIPYEELAEISVVTEDGERIPLLLDGKFVLAGCEVLNEPLES